MTSNNCKNNAGYLFSNKHYIYCHAGRIWSVRTPINENSLKRKVKQASLKVILHCSPSKSHGGSCTTFVQCQTIHIAKHNPTGITLHSPMRLALAHLGE